MRIKKILSIIMATAFFFEEIFAMPRSAPIEEKESESIESTNVAFDTSKVQLNEEKTKFIFDYNLGDNNVEFEASGFWKVLFTGGNSYSFGFGTTPTMSNPSFALKQEVDLSLLLTLNKRWYFEASFADEFDRNTIAAGYNGDGYLKSARIANRGITFPNNYSISDVNRGIGGGENEAFGLSVNFAGKKWRADGAVRYDMLESDEKTWYGKNSVSTDEIKLSSWNVGNQFALPSAQALEKVSAVFVENSAGEYKDFQGRKYKKLDSSQYLLVASKNLLIIAKDAKVSSDAAVALSFHESGMSEIEKSIEEFLNRTEEWFGNRNLSKYYFFRSNKKKVFGKINDEDVLFIQYPTGFSPFSCAFRYDCGIFDINADVDVSSKTTETVSQKYLVSIADDDLNIAERNLFSNKHIYADIYRADIKSDDCTNPKVRFPLADEFPEIYLGLPDPSIQSDLILRIRTYTPISSYDIGTDAVPGTVRVYKNGIIDSGARYDSQTGIIELSTTAGNGDKIHATWFTKSEDSDMGAIAAAAGFEYNFLKNLKTDIAISTRWTVAQDFTNEDFNSPGFITLATGTKYENDNWNVSNTTAISLENENTAGIFRILGMDDAESGTKYLSKDAGSSLPSTFVPQINISEKETLGTTIELEKSNNGSVKAEKGKGDKYIKGYAVPIEWDFSENESGETYWAATGIKLDTSNQVLASSSRFEMAFKGLKKYLQNGTRAFLQLGVEAADKFDRIEEADMTPTWEIKDVDEDETSGWAVISLQISDDKKSAITRSKNSDARLIIISDSNEKGVIFAGPYEISGQQMTVKADQNATVTSVQISDSSLRTQAVKKFNTSTNEVQELEWKFFGNEESIEIKAEKYFSQIDIASYEELNFYIKVEDFKTKNADSFSRVTFDESKDFVIFTFDNSDGDIAVKVGLNYESFENEIFDGKWHTVTVGLNEKDLKIDGKTQNSQSNKVFVKKSILPARFKIEVNPIFNDFDSKKIVESGKIFLDEVHLSGTRNYYSLQDISKVSFRKDGNIFSIGEKTIVKDFYAGAVSNFNSRIEDTGTISNSVFNANGNFKITVADIKVEGEIAKNSASHKISSDGKLFSLLSFFEEYNFNADSNILSKTDFIGIGTNNIFIEARTKGESDAYSVTQDSSMQMEGNFYGTKIGFEAEVRQRTNAIENKRERIYPEKYFSSWNEISKLQFDSGNEKASRREIGGKVKLEHQFETAKLKPSASFETKGTYKSSSDSTFTDKSNFSFIIPFNVEKHSFNFSWKKIESETEKIKSEEKIKKSGKYSDDLEELSKNLSQKAYFFTAFPVYDLVSGKLSENVKKRTSDCSEIENSSYSTTYDFSWKRQFLGTKYDFFIPNNAQLSFSRDIKSSTSTSDFYQSLLKVGFTSLNMFGKSGLAKRFDWYEQDEFNSAISFLTKIPRNDSSNMKFIMSAYTQATFYITADDYLKTGLEGSFEQKEDWSAKSTVEWKRKGNSLLINGIAGLVRPSYDRKKMTHTRTDRLNLSASCASSTSKSTRKYGIEYTHLLDTEITNHVTINSSFQTSYSSTWEKIATLEATFGLGCTIKF